MAARHLIIFACALLICVQNAYSLTCYQCEKDACKAELSKESNCTTEKDVCFSLSNPKSGNVMERGCKTKDFCEMYASCKTCTSDFCNSTPTILPSFLLIGVSAFVASRFFRE
ncbi:hypothetical protein PPYR_12528 [Photinus pyralis]|uniref:UPAR/Ly6 domain-containing protein n=1 Tax=Photinus pyralis TaxID=7054 RepID=A0A5N4A6M2_PHOPY|nr:uncharacterized protein LOC116179233 [Photinus pyralis]KAB0792908.1 hypothetical protein PPYR_12528 [Photinus pyralis]